MDVQNDGSWVEWTDGVFVEVLLYRGRPEEAGLGLGTVFVFHVGGSTLPRVVVGKEKEGDVGGGIDGRLGQKMSSPGLKSGKEVWEISFGAAG